MAANMRQPRHFLFGNITKRLMRFGNLEMIPDCVNRLNVNHGDAVVEVGSGNGQAVDEILLKEPQKVFAFEISKTFLADLWSKFNDNPKVEILDQNGNKLALSKTYRGYDNIRLNPKWEDHENLNHFKGKMIRLKFTLMNSKIFSFKIN